MSKAIETVLNNTQATAQDYFQLVNQFDYSNITLQKNKKTVLEMAVNKVEEYGDTIEFLQDCTETHYVLNLSDIQSIEGELHEEADIFVITVALNDGAKMSICIFHISTNTTVLVKESFVEEDVHSLKEALDEVMENGNKSYLMAKVIDNFGLSIKLNNVQRAYVNEDEEELNFALYIGDDFTEIKMPLVDDACNGIYRKKSGCMEEWLIKPYGQPFMEIRLAVFESEKSEGSELVGE